MPAPTPPTVLDRETLHRSAVHRDRIRVGGTIASVTDGYRSRYRQALITIATGHAQVQFTASPGGTLARLRNGTPTIVDVTLTGLVDVSSSTYMGERVRLIEAGIPPERG